MVKFFSKLSSSSGSSSNKRSSSLTKKGSTTSLDSTGSNSASAHHDSYVAREKDLDPLHKAAYKGDLAKLRKILKNNVNSLDKEKRTPLHLAAFRAHTPVVQFLLENGADPSLSDSNGKNPIHRCIESDSLPTLLIMLSHIKQNPFAKSASSASNSPSASAGSGPGEDGSTSPSSQLLILQPTQNKMQEMPHHIATRLRKLEALNELLKDARVLQHIDRVNGNSRSCVHMACEYDFEAGLQLLLEKGAEIDLPTQTGQQTGLMLAAENGFSNIVRMLMSYGADADRKDSQGNTALSVAKRLGHSECEEMLQQQDQHQEKRQQQAVDRALNKTSDKTSDRASDKASDKLAVPTVSKQSSHTQQPPSRKYSLDMTPSISASKEAATTSKEVVPEEPQPARATAVPRNIEFNFTFGRKNSQDASSSLAIETPTRNQHKKSMTMMTMMMDASGSNAIPGSTASNHDLPKQQSIANDDVRDDVGDCDDWESNSETVEPNMTTVLSNKPNNATSTDRKVNLGNLSLPPPHHTAQLAVKSSNSSAAAQKVYSYLSNLPTGNNYKNNTNSTAMITPRSDVTDLDGDTSDWKSVADDDDDLSPLPAGKLSPKKSHANIPGNTHHHEQSEQQEESDWEEEDETQPERNLDQHKSQQSKVTPKKSATPDQIYGKGTDDVSSTWDSSSETGPTPMTSSRSKEDGRSPRNIFSIPPGLQFVDKKMKRSSAGDEDNEKKTVNEPQSSSSSSKMGLRDNEGETHQPPAMIAPVPPRRHNTNLNASSSSFASSQQIQNDDTLNNLSSALDTTPIAVLDEEDFERADLSTIQEESVEKLSTNSSFSKPKLPPAEFAEGISFDHPHRQDELKDEDSFNLSLSAHANVVTPVPPHFSSNVDDSSNVDEFDEDEHNEELANTVMARDQSAATFPLETGITKTTVHHSQQPHAVTSGGTAATLSKTSYNPDELKFSKPEIYISKKPLSQSSVLSPAPSITAASTTDDFEASTSNSNNVAGGDGDSPKSSLARLKNANTTQHQQNDEEIQRLRVELSKLREKVQFWSQKYEQQQRLQSDSSDHAQRKIAEFEQEVLRLQNERTSLMDLLNEIKQQNRSDRHELSVAQDKLHSSELQVKQLQLKLELAGQTNERVVAQLETARREVEQNRDSYTHEHAENHQLRTELSVFRVKMAATVGGSNATDTSGEAAAHVNGGVGEATTDELESVSSIMLMNNELDRYIARHKEERGEWLTRNHKLQSELGTITAQMELHEQALSRASLEYSLELKKMQEELDRVKKSREKDWEDRRSQDAEMYEMKSEKKRLEENLRFIQTQYEDLRKKNQMVEEDTQSKGILTNQMTNDLQRANEKLSANEAKIESLQSEVQRLTASLSKADLENQRVHFELRQTETESSAMQRDLEKRVAHLQQENTEFDRKLKEKNSLLANLHQQTDETFEATKSVLNALQINPDMINSAVCQDRIRDLMDMLNECSRELSGSEAAPHDRAIRTRAAAASGSQKPHATTAAPASLQLLPSATDNELTSKTTPGTLTSSIGNHTTITTGGVGGGVINEYDVDMMRRSLTVSHAHIEQLQKQLSELQQKSQEERAMMQHQKHQKQHQQQFSQSQTVFGERQPAEGKLSSTVDSSLADQTAAAASNAVAKMTNSNRKFCELMAEFDRIAREEEEQQEDEEEVGDEEDGIEDKNRNNHIDGGVVGVTTEQLDKRSFIKAWHNIAAGHAHANTHTHTHGNQHDQMSTHSSLALPTHNLSTHSFDQDEQKRRRHLERLLDDHKENAEQQDKTLKRMSHKDDLTRLQQSLKESVQDVDRLRQENDALLERLRKEEHVKERLLNHLAPQLSSASAATNYERGVGGGSSSGLMQLSSASWIGGLDRVPVKQSHQSLYSATHAPGSAGTDMLYSGGSPTKSKNGGGGSSGNLLDSHWKAELDRSIARHLEAGSNQSTPALQQHAGLRSATHSRFLPRNNSFNYYDGNRSGAKTLFLSKSSTFST